MAPTILIVEDSEGAATPLEIALEAMGGVTIQLLPNALEALRVLNNSSNHIAALITDIHLPHMDGFELITVVRKSERYRSLPIVVVSGDNQPATLERLFRLGATAYFAKPYSPAAVREKLESILYAH